MSALAPVLVLLCCGPAWAQLVDSKSGIFGRVTDAQTHDPLRRAFVKVSKTQQEWNEITDEQGRFRFPQLTKAEYALIAHRDGFSDRAYKVELSDFDDRKELPIELFRQGLITGKVSDNLGQPLVNCKIEALSARTRGGPVQVLASVATNDLGEYRLSGLDSGAYQIRATYRNGGPAEFGPSPPLTMATTTHQGEFSIKSGVVITGIDFVLNPVQPARVRGTLHTDNGQIVSAAQLWISGTSGEGGHNAFAREGKFEISDVGPGTYVISAETRDPDAASFGSASVQVRGDDMNGIDIVMRPSPIIWGHVRVDGDGSNLKLNQIYFRRTDQQTALGIEAGHLDKDGNFNIALPPGEYTVSPATIDDYSVERVSFDNKPVTNWRIRVESSAEPKDFVLVLKPKP
ncbi:MAG TPA: carboxypeptidase-like regulatory domain-containing protein [Bryobacteraceae bacterium]|nr:carboxypeptidase-like regulatory domain-containing protein [Bryobacteraceae bacterium]